MPTHVAPYRPLRMTGCSELETESDIAFDGRRQATAPGSATLECDTQEHRSELHESYMPCTATLNGFMENEIQ